MSVLDTNPPLLVPVAIECEYVVYSIVPENYSEVPITKDVHLSGNLRYVRNAVQIDISNEHEIIRAIRDTLTEGFQGIRFHLQKVTENWYGREDIITYIALVHDPVFKNQSSILGPTIWISIAKTT